MGEPDGGQPAKDDGQAAKAAGFWDQNFWRAVPDRYWTSNAILNEYVNHQIIEPRSANSHVSWWIRKYLPRRCGTLLSLACGAGVAERIALAQDVADQAVGVDISSKSLEHAAAAAAQAGFAGRTRYELADLNQPNLPEAAFDVVVAFGCLHHIENLEGLYANVARCLKPGGLLYVNEYIGPNRFQYSDSLVRAANRVARFLPNAALTARELVRTDAAALAAIDPSEAVRSQDVLSAAEECFEVLDGRLYGGGLLYPLWAQVVDPAYFVNPEAPNRRSLLGSLCLLDRQLADAGVAPDLFCSHVFCRRGERAGRQSSYDPQAAMDNFAACLEQGPVAPPQGALRQKPPHGRRKTWWKWLRKRLGVAPRRARAA